MNTTVRPVKNGCIIHSVLFVGHIQRRRDMELWEVIILLGLGVLSGMAMKETILGLLRLILRAIRKA